MHIQWPRFIGSPSIHPLSKFGMCIVKRIGFDKIYVTAVPDRPSDQRLRKSNFGQLSNLSWLEIKNYLNNWDITQPAEQSPILERCRLTGGHRP